MPVPGGYGGSFSSNDSRVGLVIRRATPFLSNIQTPDIVSDQCVCLRECVGKRETEVRTYC